jgi:hypothetical protein
MFSILPKPDLSRFLLHVFHFTKTGPVPLSPSTNRNDTWGTQQIGSQSWSTGGRWPGQAAEAPVKPQGSNFLPPWFPGPPPVPPWWSGTAAEWQGLFPPPPPPTESTPPQPPNPDTIKPYWSTGNPVQDWLNDRQYELYCERCRGYGPGTPGTIPPGAWSGARQMEEMWRIRNCEVPVAVPVGGGGR